MLPPHRYYYLHNFQRALAWVGERYADLLDERERRFMADFAGLPQASQALLVRMLMRRGPWFRASRLAYDEIPNSAEAAAPLLALGWLDADTPMTLDELFALHTRPELDRLFAPMPAKAAARKADLLAALRARYPDARPHAAWMALAPGAAAIPAVRVATPGRASVGHQPAAPCSSATADPAVSADPAWRVAVADLCERLRLMFFGNLHQDWSEFVLADLGVFQYEAVPFDPSSRAFQARADVDRYLLLHACRQALQEPLDVDALLRAVADCASDNPWLEKRRAKVLLRLGQACERTQDWHAAERVYALCAYPGARHRRIRVFERMARFDEALALALRAQAAPESEEETQRLARMLPRLRRKLGQAAARRVTTPVARFDLELERPAAPTPVEFAARDHLHRDDAPVHYVENTLINSLFGLLCWPAVFAPLPGAFFHPFQRGPADLDAPDFHARREALFAACLAQLDSGEYRDTIRRRYVDKQGLQSPFVFWGALDESLLERALEHLPPAHLKRFFTRLLRDVKANRSGLPDLIRFQAVAPGYELIEIKGPGDKLQDNQIRWLAYCAEHGMPVRVCHVSWRESAP
ncbi:VRR-NUC domain-containing protein [Achromobacter ruhlandii]|uniref:VRR-NUC domain-containing protein n=1 Tax=Achromobacter ruhlandii TaxID=72557 RepID=UPI001465C2A7|nr:VRR-NUC domain-containing protein [Achromobacter ruhlandii]CAB3859888.1 Fanconi-associated nuclease 1 [Achromobacter ruhlandii]